MAVIYAKVAFAAVNRQKIKVERAGKIPAFTSPLNNFCFLSQHYHSVRIPGYDCILSYPLKYRLKKNPLFPAQLDGQISTQSLSL